MYISGPSPKFAVLPTGHKSRPNHIFCFYKNASSRDFYIMTLLLTNKFNQGSTNLGMSAMKRKDLRQKKMLLTLTSFALISQVVELLNMQHFSEALSFSPIKSLYIIIYIKPWIISCFDICECDFSSLKTQTNDRHTQLIIAELQGCVLHVF